MLVQCGRRAIYNGLAVPYTLYVYDRIEYVKVSIEGVWYSVYLRATQDEYIAVFYSQRWGTPQ